MLVLICLCFSLSTALHPNDGLNVYEVIEKAGFSYEKHHITTEDGYILETVRLMTPQKNASNFPVLFAHGVSTNAIEFVARGPKYGLGFILSNLGYDVWLLNNRGNDFSTNHTTLDPKKDVKFWDFTLHETGIYDLPAVIDHILDLTSFAKLSMIGHSLGGTSALILLAARPEYNDKVNLVLSMAGPGIMRHTPNLLFRFISALEETIARILNHLGIYELNVDATFLHDGLKIISIEELGLRKLMGALVFWTGGATTFNDDIDILLLFASHGPRGGSYWQLMHYAQFVNTGRFKAYDYHNETKNVEHYGSKDVPQYNIRKITTSFVMYYSRTDVVVREKDSRLMCKLMKNGIPAEIKEPNFGHLDFVLGKNIMEDLYNDMIERLKNAL